MQTIVFLPGWGFSAKIWSVIAAEFAKYTIKYVDFPKIGNLPFNQQTLEQVIDELQTGIPDDSIVIAWSLGGTLAIQLAASYPHKVSRLVTVGATPKFAADEQEDWIGIPAHDLAQFKQQAEADLPLLLKKFTAKISYPHLKSDVQATLRQYLLDADTIKEHFYYYLNALVQCDCRQVYQTLTLPMLHIFGEQDAILSSGSAENIANLNAKAKIVNLNNAGHAPFLTHKNEFVKTIYEFINEA